MPETTNLEQLILLLISGVSPEAAKDAAVTRLGMTPEAAAKLLVQAQDAIVKAADVDRRRELGVAISRLNTIYAQATAMSDWKIALSAQRELNRLLSLDTIRPTMPPVGRRGKAKAHPPLCRVKSPAS